MPEWRRRLFPDAVVSKAQSIAAAPHHFLLVQLIQCVEDLVFADAFISESKHQAEIEVSANDRERFGQRTSLRRQQADAMIHGRGKVRGQLRLVEDRRHDPAAFVVFDGSVVHEKAQELDATQRTARRDTV